MKRLVDTQFSLGASVKLITVSFTVFELLGKVMMSSEKQQLSYRAKGINVTTPGCCISFQSLSF